MIKKLLKKQHGFTFVEIVLAISILAIIMTVTQGILIQMIRTKKTLDNMRDIDLVLNNISNRLNREFQLIQKESLPLEIECNSSTVTAGNQIPVCGESIEKKGIRMDSISFMSKNAKQYLRGKYFAKSKRISDLVYIRYRVEKGEKEKGETFSDEKYWLIRDEIPVIGKKGERELQNDSKMTFPVYKDISEFKIRYYDSSEESWEDSWNKQDALPSLIEFTIKIKDKNYDKYYSTTSTISLFK